MDHSPHPDSSPSIDEGVGLGDYLRVVWRRRWVVVAAVAVLLVVTFVWTVRTPRAYESTAALIAPKEGSGSGLLGGLALATGMLPQQLPGPSLLSLTPNRDMLVSILKSRTIAQAAVDHFKLRERYRAQYLGDAILRLQGATTIALTREGVITIRVVDNDPQMAADIANFYMTDLDRLVAQYGMGEAGRQRGFLTQQLARAKVNLDAAEDTLRRFQEQNRAIVLPEQTRGAIDAAARLKGEITAAEVQLQVMRSFATDANPEVVALRRRIEEMNRQLGRMEYGDTTPRQPLAPERRDFSVPFARVPEVGLELVRLTRDAKVQETIVTLLTQEVERARINEARDLPTVQVLDRAVPAERHSWPSLKLNLAVGGLTSVILGVILALAAEYLTPPRARSAR